MGKSCCGVRARALASHNDIRAALDCLPEFAANFKEYVMKKADDSESTIINGSFYVCFGLRVPQLRKRPRPCLISGVCDKIIIIIVSINLINVLAWH